VTRGRARARPFPPPLTRCRPRAAAPAPHVGARVTAHGLRAAARRATRRARPGCTQARRCHIRVQPRAAPRGSPASHCCPSSIKLFFNLDLKTPITRLQSARAHTSVAHSSSALCNQPRTAAPAPHPPRAASPASRTLPLCWLESVRGQHGAAANVHLHSGDHRHRAVASSLEHSQRSNLFVSRVEAR
jgi:hypothetical protein